MKLLTWLRVLNKRTLKTPAFLVLLVLIPLLTAALALLSGGERGVLTVAVAAGDEFSDGVVRELLSTESALRYIVCADGEAARARVAAGEADAAWIFDDASEAALRRYAAGRGAAPAVTVVEREDNVLLRLSREKLYTALFPAISRMAWEAFLARKSDAPLPAEAELDRYYNWMQTDESLVRFTYIDGAAGGGEDYLLSPVRGLLAILLVLGALAASAVYIRDRRRGVLTWLPGRAAFPVSAAYALLPALDLALVVWLTLCLSGLGTDWGYEALLLLLLAVFGAGLALLLARLARNETRLGAAALVLAVLMLALCPVFLSIRSLRPLSLLLPPYYYLLAVHDTAFAGYFAIYAAAVWALDYLLFRVRKFEGEA